MPQQFTDEFVYVIGDKECYVRVEGYYVHRGVVTENQHLDIEISDLDGNKIDLSPREEDEIYDHAWSRSYDRHDY